MINTAFLSTAFNHYYDCSRCGKISTAYVCCLVVVQILLVASSRVIGAGDCNLEGYSECQYRNGLYRGSLAAVILFFWLYLAESVSVREFVTKYFRWFSKKVTEYRKRIASLDTVLACILVAAVFIIIPNYLLELYISFFVPILGGLWTIYQGYASLSLTTHCHSTIVSSALSTMMSQTHSMRLYLLNNATMTSTVDAALIWRARWLTSMYALLYTSSIMFLLSIWYSGLFTSLLSNIIVLGTLMLGIIAAYVALKSVVNQGLLIPTTLLLYLTALCLQVLFLDPSNPHNTHYLLRVAPVSGTAGDSPAVYTSYSASLQGYLYANDAFLFVICALSMYHSVVYGMECTSSAAYNLIVRMGRAVTKLGALCMCRNSVHKYEKFEHPEESNTVHTEVLQGPERISLRRSGSGSYSTHSRSENSSSAYLDTILDASEERMHTEREPEENDSLIALESGNREQSNVQRYPISANANINSTVSTINYEEPTAGRADLASFYLRMLLLAAYTPLWLTRWGSGDSLAITSETDFRLFPKASTLFGAGESSVYDRIATQYTLITVLLLAHLAVCCLYAYSAYCKYEVNAKYLAARRLLFQQGVYVDESSDEEDANDLDIGQHGGNHYAVVV